VTTRKHSVKVEILGESYAIRTEAAPEHTRAVAEHLDRSIRQILAGGSVIEANRAAILAALQITSELFQAREASASITSAMLGLSAEVARMLPPTKRGDGIEVGIESSVHADADAVVETGADAT
jgi:cell division protein ZapA